MLLISAPMLNAPVVSKREKLEYEKMLVNLCLQFQLAPLRLVASENRGQRQQQEQHERDMHRKLKDDEEATRRRYGLIDDTYRF